MRSTVLWFPWLWAIGCSGAVDPVSMARPGVGGDFVNVSVETGEGCKVTDPFPCWLRTGVDNMQVVRVETHASTVEKMLSGDDFQDLEGIVDDARFRVAIGKDEDQCGPCFECGAVVVFTTTVTTRRDPAAGVCISKPDHPYSALYRKLMDLRSRYLPSTIVAKDK